MPAPTGVKNPKWNQAISRISQRTGLTSLEVDLWLSTVWVSMLIGDEINGNPEAHSQLKTFLEEFLTEDPTLPLAFKRWATS